MARGQCRWLIYEDRAREWRLSSKMEDRLISGRLANAFLCLRSSAARVIWSAVVAASLAISSSAFRNAPFSDTSFESFQIWTRESRRSWKVNRFAFWIGFSFFFFFFWNWSLAREYLVCSKIWKKERLGHTQHACVLWLGHEFRFPPPVADTNTGWFNLAPL